MTARALAGTALAAIAIACGGSTGGGGSSDGGVFGGAGGASGGSGGASGSGASGGAGAVGGSSGVGGSAAAGGTGGLACVAPAPGDLAGSFFLAASANLAPGKPIVFLAQTAASAAASGVALSLTLQPLAAADRKTPVGPPIAGLQANVAANGAMAGGPYLIAVPGAANPITGSDLEMEVSLSGEFCGASDFYCGSITGTVTKPIALDLTGSTFTLQRVTDPSTYPEPPYINCQQTLAEPISP